MKLHNSSIVFRLARRPHNILSWSRNIEVRRHIACFIHPFHLCRSLTLRMTCKTGRSKGDLFGWGDDHWTQHKPRGQRRIDFGRLTNDRHASCIIIPATPRRSVVCFFLHLTLRWRYKKRLPLERIFEWIVAFLTPRSPVIAPELRNLIRCVLIW